MGKRRVDIGEVLALAWLGVAVGLTIVFGPMLGARGWLWLGAHHLLCVAGVTHELSRARARARARPPEPPSG